MSAGVSAGVVACPWCGEEFAVHMLAEIRRRVRPPRSRHVAHVVGLSALAEHIRGHVW